MEGVARALLDGQPDLRLRALRRERPALEVANDFGTLASRVLVMSATFSSATGMP